MSTTQLVNMKTLRKGDRVALTKYPEFTGTVRKVVRKAGEKWTGCYSYQYRITWHPHVEVKWDRPLSDYRTESSVNPEELVSVEEAPA